MKFCKTALSEKRHHLAYGEHVLRGLVFLFVLLVAIGACRRTTDPGFDIVAVPSAAYLAVTLPEGGLLVPDGGTRDAAVTLSAKCEPPPEDEFEPSDDVPECPSQNSIGWSLDPRATARHRDKDEDVCCYKRGVVRVPEEE